MKSQYQIMYQHTDTSQLRGVQQSYGADTQTNITQESFSALWILSTVFEGPPSTAHGRPGNERVGGGGLQLEPIGHRNFVCIDPSLKVLRSASPCSHK